MDEAAGGGDVPTTPQPSTSSSSGRTLSGQLSPMLSPITRRKLTPHPKKLVAGMVNLLLVLNILIFLHFKYISFDFLAFNAQS